MTRRTSILGAAFLCALCFCALGAGSASASGLTWHKCEEAAGTANQGKFSESHCETTSETGKFATVPLGVGTTSVTVTGTETFTLSATVGGILFEIKCTTLAGEDSVTNTNGAGEAMTATGSGPLTFSGCTVVKPEKQECKVTVPTVEGTTLTTSMSETGGPTTFKFTPKSELFVTLTISGCKTTGLNGEKTVKGTASGVNAVNKRSTVSFTTTSGSNLTFGGAPATLVGKAHSVVKGTEKTVAPETEVKE